MSRFARLILMLCLLTLLVTGSLFAQSVGAWPQGLLVSKDPQTGYVEAFEYVATEPINRYSTAYRLPGGLTRHIQNSAVLEDVHYPSSATQPASRAQVEASLGTLESLARRYPQYTAIFAASEARLRTVPTQALPANAPSAGRLGSPAAAPVAGSTTHPSAVAPPAPGIIASLGLRNGTLYQEVTILHVDGDRFTIRHQKGIAEVLFRDLPADAKSVPPAVQTLLKAYQDKVTAAETARKQAEVAAASQTPVPSTDSASSVTNASNAPSIPPLPSSLAVPSKGHNSVLTGLTVKGLCIGMDGTDAAKTLVEQGQGKLVVEPTPLRGEHGYAVYLFSNGHKATGMIGEIRMDPQDGTVSMFRFYPALSNFLFNTTDQNADEFAQTFINAYNVPTVKPTTIGTNRRCWSHTSTEGWTLDIYTDKAIQVMRTPDRKFD